MAKIKISVAKFNKDGEALSPMTLRVNEPQKLAPMSSPSIPAQAPSKSQLPSKPQQGVQLPKPKPPLEADGGPVTKDPYTVSVEQQGKKGCTLKVAAGVNYFEVKCTLSNQEVVVEVTDYMSKPSDAASDRGNMRYWNIRALQKLGLTNVAEALCGITTAQIMPFLDPKKFGTGRWPVGPFTVDSAYGDSTYTECPWDFRQTVTNWILTLIKKPAGWALFKAIENAGEVSIRFEKDAPAHAARDKSDGSLYVAIDPEKLKGSKYMAVSLDSKGNLKLEKDQEEGPLFVLGHELIHALHRLGTKGEKAYQNRRANGPNWNMGWVEDEEQLTITGYLKGTTLNSEPYSESLLLVQPGKDPRKDPRKEPRYGTSNQYPSGASDGKLSKATMELFYGPKWQQELFPEVQMESAADVNVKATK